MSDAAADEEELELDGPWKEAIEQFFPEFFEFYFPHVHSAVDWARGYEFLDKELEKLAPEAEIGRGTVDKLARVWLTHGEETWLLIHIEVQNQPQREFPARMFRYHHRLRDRYDRMPVSIAVLGDDRPAWRPDHYAEESFGCRVRFDYLTTKLLDFAPEMLTALENPNPYAAFTLAHLETLATRGEPDRRLEIKWTLFRGLFGRGYTRERIILMLRFVDWVMKLRPPQRMEYDRRSAALDKENAVPFVSSLERMLNDREARGEAKGTIQGLLAAIESLLDVRFGAAGVAALSRLRTVSTIEGLSALPAVIVRAATLDDVLAVLPHEEGSTDGK